MTAISMTSELEAVNTLLDAISEAPVSSLSASGVMDLASARATLSEVSREVQQKGWAFNTEAEYPLPRNVEGKVPVPENALKIIVGSVDAVQRGSFLYNREKHSPLFDATVQAEVIFCLPWDELPQAARHYIMIKASRIFQVRRLGSDIQFKFSDSQEDNGLQAMNEAEGAVGGYNVFNSQHALDIISR
jgi:hypothetical protein